MDDPKKPCFPAPMGVTRAEEAEWLKKPYHGPACGCYFCYGNYFIIEDLLEKVHDT